MIIDRPALAVYLMANADAETLALAAIRGGATMLELGIPYSDPLADGPTVQAAATAALSAGMTTPAALTLLGSIRRRCDVPLVVMTYGAIIEAYGVERFCAEAAASGAEGLIAVDVPPEESNHLREASAGCGIDLVHLVSVTSSPARLAAAATASRGFVYLVAAVGTTGARASLDRRLGALIANTRRAAPTTPLLAGFGVSRPDQVRSVIGAGADGVIVGSAAIDAALRGGPDELERFTARLATGLDAGAPALPA